MWYARARARDDEPFDTYQFLSTLLVGAAIGLVAGLAGGTTVAREPVEAQLAGYVGLISLVEGALKALAGQFDRGGTV